MSFRTLFRCDFRESVDATGAAAGPDESGEDTDPTDDRVVRVERVCRAIEAAAARGDTVALADLAELAGTAPDTVRRDFLRVLGVTPKHYADGLRVERLRT